MLERRRREFKATGEAKPAPRYRPAGTAASDEPPVVSHQPVIKAAAGKPLTISAEVRDPDGVKWVHLRYRSVNQQQDYRTLTMLPEGGNDRYQAVIPAEEIVPTWDLMYLIEVMDKPGNGAIFPDLNRETPYIVVRLTRSQ